MAENQTPETNEHSRFGILKFFMDYNGRYHDHKETMAWVATAFYIVGVISMALAVRHIASHCCSWRVFFSVFFTVAGAIISWFVCWQFNNRYIAYQRAKKCALRLSELKIVQDAGVDWLKEEGGNPRVPEILTYIAVGVVTIIAIIIVSWH